MRLALKIAPQHSTQYADMTARLAAPELLASPAGDRVESVEATVLGGQGYLLATLANGAGGDVLMPVRGSSCVTPSGVASGSGRGSRAHRMM